MPVVLIDVAFAIVMALAGIALGVWLRGNQLRRRGTRRPEEVHYAREVLARLHLLTKRVAAHVGEHSSRVEEINEELSSGEANETEAVVSVVTKLIEANGQMQQQLGDAKVRLQEQARLVEWHTAQARTDALTGLANRRAFDDEMARRLAKYRRRKGAFSLAMVDVDNFKEFNDTYGHQAGDEVLQGIAEVLRKTARGMDVVARYGGEEFAVILPATRLADAAAGAERFREAIEEVRFRYGITAMHVTASIGVAEILPGEEVAGLIERADAALYASKTGGRNCLHWHDGETIRPFGKQTPAAVEPAPGAQPQPAEVEQPQPREVEQPQPEEPLPKTDPLLAADWLGEDFEQRPIRAVSRAEFCSVLNHRLAEYKRGGAPPSVLLVKIDDYAGILSRHDRRIADLVLQAAGQLLEAAVREMDVVAKHDTAVFSAMLPGAGLAGTIGVAERLRSAVARCALPLPEGSLQFTVSTGAAEALGDDTLERFLNRAEEALDASVRTGGNCSYLHNGQWSEPAALMLEESL